MLTHNKVAEQKFKPKSVYPYLLTISLRVAFKPAAVQRDARKEGRSKYSGDPQGRGI